MLLSCRKQHQITLSTIIVSFKTDETAHGSENNNQCYAHSCRCNMLDISTEPDLETVVTNDGITQVSDPSDDDDDGVGIREECPWYFLF